MRTSRFFLLLVVFLCGMTSMAIEMTASRLIGTFFGSPLPIWAILIGMVMIYLSVGYTLGGRLADRRPHASFLYGLVGVAAAATGLIPPLSRPLLGWAQQGLANVAAGLYIGALVGVLVLLSIPMVLLGCVSPFAIRLEMMAVDRAGRTSGSIYALSTVGSILGTLLPSFVTIPLWGVSLTFYAFSFLLLLVALIGVSRWTTRLVFLLLLLGIGVLVVLFLVGAWRGWREPPPGTVLVDERESVYNYIQVYREGDRIYLALNEGLAVHSYHSLTYERTRDPFDLLSYGPWDIFLIAPYFAPDVPEGGFSSMCLIGSAAGTIPKQYAAVYGDRVQIDGVELDPEIVEVGRRYFRMGEEEALGVLHVYVQDGRYFLSTVPRRYDIVAIDAYRQPYIPFHLTTEEFFAQVRAHLESNGVCAINVGHVVGDERLVDAIAATMQRVFPSVFVIDLPGYGVTNSIVVATMRPSSLADFAHNAARLEHPVLRHVIAYVQDHARVWSGEGIVFTDDRAPVEHVVDQMILNYVQAR